MVGVTSGKESEWLTKQFLESPKLPVRMYRTVWEINGGPECLSWRATFAQGLEFLMGQPPVRDADGRPFEPTRLRKPATTGQ